MVCRNVPGLWPRALLGAVLLFAACACGKADTEARLPDPAKQIEVRLDKSDPERLLRYYFGGYAAPGGSDPFTAGLMSREGGRFYVDVEKLEALHPGTGKILGAALQRGRLDWDGLASFIEATYYEARYVPSTLAALQAETPYRSDAAAWFEVEIDGVMTTARRHVYVAEAALRSALSRYRQNGERLIYPVGTTLVGEHYLDGAHVETTVMRKRDDGFWDFFAYGRDGALTHATQALPRSLDTPTQCAGCHFGAKLFEPERSFPGPALPGPEGPRAVYVAEALRDREVVTFFDEHRKRSDTVLGIYNTLFVARLRAERRAGRLAEADAQLLDELGL